MNDTPRLNLPPLGALEGCTEILVAGMGGGFDLFCGLPLCFALQARGVNVHLANYSFSQLEYIKGGERLSPTLLGMTPEITSRLPYAPELHLAHWFREVRGEERTIWCFSKVGAVPLGADFRRLVEHLHIDGLILVDGGVDSLVRGDEPKVGTPVEDGLTLLAAQSLPANLPKVVACIGLGAERDMSHDHVFENMAALTAVGAFFGSCALTQEMLEFAAYEAATLYTHERTVLDQSVINASILSAVRGKFGNYHLIEKTRGSRLRISPLMSLYWFFEAGAVAERNLLLSSLQGTQSFHDALRSYVLARQQIRLRGERAVGLE